MKWLFLLILSKFSIHLCMKGYRIKDPVFSSYFRNVKERCRASELGSKHLRAKVTPDLT